MEPRRGELKASWSWTLSPAWLSEAPGQQNKETLTSVSETGFTYTGGVVRELLQLTGWKFRELTVSFFRYLGVTLNNKLHWSDHTDTPHKTITDSVAALTISQRRKGRKWYLNHFRISRRSFFLPFTARTVRNVRIENSLSFSAAKNLLLVSGGFVFWKNIVNSAVDI